MVKATWITLVALFIIYTISIYLFGTKKEQLPPSEQALAGWHIWQEKNCQGCHQLYGLGGYMGPDLTNTFSEKGPEYIKVFSKFGSGRMPVFNLSDSEANHVNAFLQWVDKSGKSAIASKYVHWSGTYILE